MDAFLEFYDVGGVEFFDEGDFAEEFYEFVEDEVEQQA